MCEYCENKIPSFFKFGGTNTLDICINNQGALRICVYDNNDYLVEEEIFKVEFCPMCGRKFGRNTY